MTDGSVAAARRTDTTVWSAAIPVAYEQFDENGRMKPSSYYDRVVDVMEELVKFTLHTRGFQLPDRPLQRKKGRSRKGPRAEPAS
jgi:arsenic resistance protein ArsH